MRFLLPLVVIGALFASNIVVAATPVDTHASWMGVACSSRALLRRAERFLKVGRVPTCDPGEKVVRTRVFSSSSSSSSSVSLAAGSRTGVPCPNEGALRRATRLIAAGLPVACDPDATDFYGPNAISSSIASAISSSIAAAAEKYDQEDTTIRSQFLLLGEVSPVLGAASFFIEEEPLRLTSISINLQSDVTSIQSLLVYDDDKKYLGRATLNTSTSITNRNYRLALLPGAMTIGKREPRSVYFRAQLSPFTVGGQSGLVAQIATITVEGNGEWSSDSYRKQSSQSDTFPQFVASRSTITSVKNALQSDGALVIAPNQLLSSFTFDARKTDSSALAELKELRFQIEKTGDISLSNVQLKTQGLPEGMQCTNTSVTVTCSSIPAVLGSVTDAPRTILLYGDISGGSTLHASLRLTLNEAGSPQSAGSISWYDGTTQFDWVGLDAPVASGTNWKY